MIFGFLAVGGVKLLALTVKNKQYADTRNNFETVNAALVQFVSREKRMPCPADGSLNDGVELRTGTAPATCNDVQRNGVVPWKALGLTEIEVTDGWFNRFTYRVAPELVSENMMDLSKCDPAGTFSLGTSQASCNPSCTAAALSSCTSLNDVIKGKGFIVNNIGGIAQANPSNSSGAAYVLISHGENTTGAYNSNGILVTGSVPSGTAEISNANNRIFQNTYTADNFNASAAPDHFDDLVYFKTVHSIVAMARLDARAH